MNIVSLLRAAAAASFGLSVVAAPAFAAGSHGGGHGASATGEPGQASAVSRTIEVVMHDNYYEPENVAVEAGETIRFRVRNEGDFVHEFNIGTAAMHAAHQDEMMMMAEHGVLKPTSIDQQAAKAMQASMGHGMHDDPNSVLLEPGASGEVIWSFPGDADVTLEFACNVPGHYASGMVGQVELKR